ncbi:phage major capsid protein [Mycobacterium colombiense]|uniref:Phage major capsid protein n=1 Tax=Mycobacterium colombiense TaxID=339268 RepID=A0A329MCU1_9MYCO|nr:phage major capsid protein [Mycobacterium colombiense]RAV17508.1 phage major capsid protein [Mycobacterium colombiense]
MPTKAELDHKGRELTDRLKNFATEFEANDSITEDEKETAWKALEGEFKAWESNMSRCESASEMAAKLANCGEALDAKSGKSVTKFEVASPMSRAGIKALAREAASHEEFAEVFGFKDGFRKKLDVNVMLGMKSLSNDATEAHNLMGEGLDGNAGIAAAAAGQTPFLGGTFGQGIQPDWRPGIVEQLFYQLTIPDLISSFATTAPNISYLTESSDNMQATSVAEGGTFPFSSIEIAREYAQIGKIANALTITDEAVSDAATLYNFVQGRLLLGLQRQEEVQILAGTGYPGVGGLLSFASNFTKSSAGSIYGDTHATAGSALVFPPAGTYGAGAQAISLSSLPLGRVVTGAAGTSGDTAGKYPDPLTVSLNLKDVAVDIELAVFQSPTAHIMNPRDWQLLETAQDNNGQFMNTSYFGNVYGVSRTPVKSLWNIPVVTTPLMPKGLILTGWFDAQSVQTARRQGVQMQMTNSNESDFIEGKITVRADERLGLLCYRPTAFQLTQLVKGANYSG